MKKTKLWGLLTALTLLLLPSACSDDEKPNPDPIPIPITKGVRPEAYYKGEVYTAETGSYWINFIIDATASEVEQVLCIDFNSKLSADPDFAQPELGLYTFDAEGSHADFTLNGDGDSYVARIIDAATEDIEYISITGGTMELSQEENGYTTVECKLTLENGKKYTFTYTGPLTFFNRTEQGNMSNITEDLKITNLTQAFGIYYGDIFEAGSDMWNLILSDDQYDIDQLYGTGNVLQIAINVTNGAADYIPDGTYTVIDINTAETLPAGTLINGIYNPMYGGYWGCWFYNPERQLESALQQGGLKVSRQGETYTFDVDLCDRAGRHVRAVFTGKIIRFENL